MLCKDFGMDHNVMPVWNPGSAAGCIYRREEYRLQGNAVWGPEVALSGKIGTEDRTRSVHIMFHNSFSFIASNKLNEISQQFDHLIEDS